MVIKRYEKLVVYPDPFCRSSMSHWYKINNGCTAFTLVHIKYRNTHTHNKRCFAKGSNDSKIQWQTKEIERIERKLTMCKLNQWTLNNHSTLILCLGLTGTEKNDGNDCKLCMCCYDPIPLLRWKITCIVLPNKDIYWITIKTHTHMKDHNIKYTHAHCTHYWRAPGKMYQFLLLQIDYMLCCIGSTLLRTTQMNGNEKRGWGILIKRTTITLSLSLTHTYARTSHKYKCMEWKRRRVKDRITKLTALRFIWADESHPVNLW